MIDLVHCEGQCFVFVFKSVGKLINQNNNGATICNLSANDIGMAFKPNFLVGSEYEYLHLSYFSTLNDTISLTS